MFHSSFKIQIECECGYKNSHFHKTKLWQVKNERSSSCKLLLLQSWSPDSWLIIFLVIEIYFDNNRRGMFKVGHLELTWKITFSSSFSVFSRIFFFLERTVVEFSKLFEVLNSLYSPWLVCSKRMKFDSFGHIRKMCYGSILLLPFSQSSLL